MNRIPASGELYRHFKDKLYQIVAVATHSETGEKLVIYQALYGDYRVYARPLAMFGSEVDHVKYPEVKQRYRFERVRAAPGESLQTWQPLEGEQSPAQAAEVGGIPVAEQGLPGTADDAVGETVDPGLLAFLDAESMEEKYDIIRMMRSEMTDRLINSFAVSLDVVIPEGSTDERYEALKNCVRTRMRYEGDRLR